MGRIMKVNRNGTEMAFVIRPALGSWTAHSSEIVASEYTTCHCLLLKECQFRLTESNPITLCCEYHQNVIEY